MRLLSRTGDAVLDDICRLPPLHYTLPVSMFLAHTQGVRPLWRHTGRHGDQECPGKVVEAYWYLWCTWVRAGMFLSLFIFTLEVQRTADLLPFASAPSTIALSAFCKQSATVYFPNFPSQPLNLQCKTNALATTSLRNLQRLHRAARKEYYRDLRLHHSVVGEEPVKGTAAEEELNPFVPLTTSYLIHLAFRLFTSVLIFSNLFCSVLYPSFTSFPSFSSLPSSLLSCPVLSCLVLSCLVLSNLILSYLFSSCLVQSSFFHGMEWLLGGVRS